MKYVCLCYMEEEKLERLPEHDRESIFREQVAYDETLRENGQVLASEALESIETATTVRVRGGKVTVTDGPFAETKEQLGGFFLIEARDLNDAIRIASQFPSARVGSMEIRPVWEIREYVHDRQVRDVDFGDPQTTKSEIDTESNLNEDLAD